MFFVVFTSWNLSFSLDDNLVFTGNGSDPDRNQAVVKGKLDALEKTILTIVTAPCEQESYQLKRNQILSKALESLNSYEIVSENKTQNGMTIVSVRVLSSQIELKNILNNAQTLIESMAKPRILILIKEQNSIEPDRKTYWAQNFLRNFLKKNYKFSVIDSQFTPSQESQRVQTTFNADSVSLTATLGLQYNAEVVIVGQAISSIQDDSLTKNSGMTSVNTEINLRAINCASGKLIGSETKSVNSIHLNPHEAVRQSTQKASESAMKALLDAIVRDWQVQYLNGVIINMQVEKIRSLRIKNNAIHTLRSLKNVGVVRENSWDPNDGVLNINIQYKGNITEFVNRIDNYKLKSGGGSFLVTGNSGLNVISIIQSK